MQKSSLPLSLIVATMLMLTGCGNETKSATNVTNNYYKPGQPTSKTLYPKTAEQRAHAVVNSATSAKQKALAQHTEQTPSPSHPATHHENNTVKITPAQKAATVSQSTVPSSATGTAKATSVHKTKTAQTTAIQKKDTAPAEKPVHIVVHPAAAAKSPAPMTQKLSAEKPKNSVVYTLPSPPQPVKPVDVHAQIAKVVKAVEAVKAEAAKKILKSLEVIKAVKPIHATPVPNPVPSAVDIVKAEAAAEIAKATAFAQSAHAVAKAKIAKAVSKVQIAQIHKGHLPASREEVQKAKAKAAAEIAKSVAATQIARAKAAATIAESVAKVEKEKAKKYPSLAEKLFGKE